MDYGDNVTLGEAREIIRKGEQEGMDCPCCGQFIKVYRRRIHSTMAKQLIQFLRYCEKNFKLEAHVRDFIDGHPGDFAKLAYWGLIVQKAKADGEDQKSSGRWSLTTRGVRFARYQTVEPTYARVRDGEVLGLEGPAIDIAQCLGKKYSYSEVMGT